MSKNIHTTLLFFKEKEGYFVGLFIAIEFIILSFFLIHFVNPRLEMLGEYGEFFSLLTGSPVLALAAWKNFELFKYLGKLSISTHIKIISISALIIIVTNYLFKPPLTQESNGSNN